MIRDGNDSAFINLHLEKLGKLLGNCHVIGHKTQYYKSFLTGHSGLAKKFTHVIPIPQVASFAGHLYMAQA